MDVTSGHEHSSFNMLNLKRSPSSFTASQAKKHVQKYRQDPDKPQQERKGIFFNTKLIQPVQVPADEHMKTQKTGEDNAMQLLINRHIKTLKSVNKNNREMQLCIEWPVKTLK